MVATEIRLDLNGKKGPDLWARLGESDTRQIVMHPGYYDPEGNWTPLIIDAENIFAKFRIVKPDNTFVIQDASLYLPSDPSIFVVTLPETATQVAGLGYYDLRIGDGETPDTFLYSAGGRFIIDDDMITDEMIASVASVNGLIFPDDFLTSADLSDYATKEYVNDAIAGIETGHVYSTEEKVIGKWIDGSNIYEITFYGSINITTLSRTWYQIVNASDVINVYKMHRVWTAPVSYIVDPSDGTILTIPSTTGAGYGMVAAGKLDDNSIKIAIQNISSGMAEYALTLQYIKSE